MTPIYLDYDATTPVAREVTDALRAYLREHFGNPSSSNGYGQRTREAVARAARGGVSGARPAVAGIQPGAQRVDVIQSLLITRRLQGVDPYTYPVDGLGRPVNP
jgi:hypothetical protein